MFRLGPPKYSLGIDIGSSALKFVQMKKTKQGPQIINHGYEKYSAGVFQDGVLQDPSAVIQMIKNLKKEYGLKYDQVFTAITSSNTILRFLPLPDMGDEELAHAIDGEAEQYVPYPLDTVNIHFAKLAKVEQEGMTRILCLLAVAQKEYVENIVDIFKAVGVSQLDCLDIDSLAVINALDNFLKKSAQGEQIGDVDSLEDMEQIQDSVEIEAESSSDDEVVAIVSIGARSTIINVLKDGILRFSRNVPISGNNITDVIRSVYKVTVEEAEDIKIEKSKEAVEGNEDQEFSDVVHTTVEEIAGEIRRSFDYYKAQHREPVIHRVFLTGGTAKLKDIDVLLSNELSVDVEIADPSYGLLKDMDNPELFEENLQEYTVAIGLALRGCGTNEDA